MSKPDLRKAVAFMELLEAFNAVDRVAHPRKDVDRHENDVEHSYNLTMLGWYLAQSLNLPLDTGKLLKYGLVHDLVEAYAGDTYIQDEEALKTKHAREKAAQERILREFPDFMELNAYIAAYEAQEDEESRFLKKLDKFIPVLMNYMQRGKTWKEMDVSMAWLVEHKREKIGGYPNLSELFEEIVSILEKDPLFYFAKK